MNTKNADRAVSPVVGVILMVAVTVILSAVIGAFVFDLGQSSTGEPQESLGVRFSETDIGVTTQFITSTDSTVYVRYQGTDVRTLAGVNAGDSVFIPAAPGESVTIRTNESVITTHTVDETPALVSYWTMNDEDVSGTTLRDAAGTGNTATINGDPQSTAGVVGNAFEFDGNGDNVTASDALPEQGSFTISLWMKSSKVNGTIYDQSNGNKYLGVKLDEGVIGWYFESDNEADIQLDYTPASPTGEWYHIVGTGTWNGSDHKLYVNGVLVNSSTRSLTGKPTLNGPMIGADVQDYGMANVAFAGSIDDVRIYNRELSASEVAALSELKRES